MAFVWEGVPVSREHLPLFRREVKHWPARTGRCAGVSLLLQGRADAVFYALANDHATMMD